MLEPWRSRYLQALGVDIYVPRLPLPGAREPLAPAWDPAALPTPVPAPAAETGETPTAPRETVQRPRLELPRESGRPAPQPRPAPAAEPPAPAAAGARFTLTVAQADGALILDEAPDPGARADYQKLLANVLFALGRPAALRLDLFQWPPAVKLPQLDQGEAAARETLSAYLQKRLQGGGLLLLLGESAGRWVSPELRQQLAPPPLSCGVSAVSAWRCLREPAAKRQLWQDLRPLAVP